MMEASRPRTTQGDSLRRVVVFECCPCDDLNVASLLDDEGCEVVVCQRGEDLLEELMTRRPHAVVSVLKRECQGELAVLHLTRRSVPGVPLILIASDSSLAVERMARELRPFYYAVAPVEMEEIREALQAALHPTNKRRSVG